jgi:hypothetical protein
MVVPHLSRQTRGITGKKVGAYTRQISIIIHSQLVSGTKDDGSTDNNEFQEVQGEREAPQQGGVEKHQ